MSKITNFARSPGRPRNHKVRPIVLAATHKRVLQHGCSAVGIQMIAKKAGVGRQTLYRRWPSCQVVRRHWDDVAWAIPRYVLWFSSVCRESE
ncbi:TetR/AcrR family transcriptional regulator [Komagataeibacter sp. FNDCF1]|uniref:TetR/AcrR family transcriptional regulator n=1 Tax=Komagataeibacter sp. FNDCF1 TaxID=2878681 RepID=UPI00351D3623|nr:TetR/AcrR family transcriptional regulator [Komagataeibacter sp. FNDCF1]